MQYITNKNKNKINISTNINQLFSRSKAKIFYFLYKIFSIFQEYTLNEIINPLQNHFLLHKINLEFQRFWNYNHDIEML